ncbi:MAG: protein YgfX [Candidimonas sp.]
MRGAALLCIGQALSPWPAMTAAWLAGSLCILALASLLVLARRCAQPDAAGRAAEPPQNGNRGVPPGGGLVSHAWVSRSWIVLKVARFPGRKGWRATESVVFRSCMPAREWSRLCAAVAGLRYQAPIPCPARENPA